ncbi:putative aspartate aminotransferase [Bacillus subtilis subsp. subtilis]|nr:putative aspartate aminotransferase [Bacillus subtilis subsp. subtilis]AYK58920.1 hypothetical protein D9C10_18140 [Bacillus subtilis subsp. subtilis]AYK65707.1 hypothetical protein D9C11_09350 [Bacillus subtilis subsp. subtilis]
MEITPSDVIKTLPRQEFSLVFQKVKEMEKSAGICHADSKAEPAVRVITRNIPLKSGMFLYAFHAAAVSGNLLPRDVGGFLRGKKRGERCGFFG